MNDEPDRKDGDAERILSAVEQLVAEGTAVLSEMNVAWGAGAEAPAAVDAAQVRQLRRVLVAAYQERERVQEHQKRNRGKGHNGSGSGPDHDGTGDNRNGALDLDAARAEVGRRLARLRDAGGAGGVPGEPEC